MTIRKENARNFAWHFVYVIYFLLCGTSPIHYLIIKTRQCEPDKIDLFAYLYPPMIFLLAFFNMFSKRLWNGNVFIFMFTDTKEDLSFEIKGNDEYANAVMWCVGILLPITMLGFAAEDCILAGHYNFYKYYWLWVAIGVGIAMLMTYLIPKYTKQEIKSDSYRIHWFIYIIVALLGWWTVTVVMDLTAMLIYAPQAFIWFL